MPEVLIHLTPGPSRVITRRPVGERWCFGCRKRLPHEDVLLGDEESPDEEPSYYEPVWVRRCSQCGKDRTRFPGRGM